MCILNLFDALM